MPFYMIKQDIITMEVDAIVNPTDEEYSGGGGTDRHIQKNAGPGSVDETGRHGFAESWKSNDYTRI